MIECEKTKAGGCVAGAIDVSASRRQFFAFDVGVGQACDAAARRRRKFIFSLSAGERIIAIGNIFMMAAICAAKNPQQIEQALKRQGITHLIVREDLLSDFVTDNRTPDQAVVWNQSAQCRITLDFGGRGYAVH